MAPRDPTVLTRSYLSWRLHEPRGQANRRSRHWWARLQFDVLRHAAIPSVRHGACVHFGVARFRVMSVELL